MKEQNWNIAKIFMLGTEQMGYFIPLMTAVQNFVSTNGGLSRLKKFEKKKDSQHNRVYFSLNDMTEMQSDLEFASDHFPPIYIALYADGTQIVGRWTVLFCGLE